MYLKQRFPLPQLPARSLQHPSIVHWIAFTLYIERRPLHDVKTRTFRQRRPKACLQLLLGFIGREQKVIEARVRRRQPETKHRNQNHEIEPRQTVAGQKQTAKSVSGI